MTTNAIKSAATAVAAAKLAAVDAGSALAEAEASRAKVAARVAALETERSAIVAERAAGKESPDHGARLALLGADLENLAEMLTEHHTAVNAARTAAQVAAGHVASAQRALDREADAEALVRLIEHANKVDGILLTTIRDIADTWRRLWRSPGRESWTPTRALADAIKQLDLTRANRR